MGITYKFVRPDFFEEPSEEATIFFASDWSTATGATSTAVSDGGTWPGQRCAQWLDLLTVIETPSGQGYPEDMANVLRVSAGGSTGCGMVTKYNFPTVDVGDSVWYRIFLQYVSTSNNLANQHFLQPDNPGVAHPWNWRWQTPMNGGTQVRLEWILVNELTGWPNTNCLYGVVLDIGTLYRLEWQFERISTDEAWMYPRIYLGNTDTLVFDASDFVDRGEGVTDGDPLTESTRPMNLTRAAALTEIEIGQNGPAGSSTNEADFFRAAGFAMSYDGWVGPYTAERG